MEGLNENPDPRDRKAVGSQNIHKLGQKVRDITRLPCSFNEPIDEWVWCRLIVVDCWSVQAFVVPVPIINHVPNERDIALNGS